MSVFVIGVEFLFNDFSSGSIEIRDNVSMIKNLVFYVHSQCRIYKKN